jgi:hypothetical protein
MRIAALLLLASCSYYRTVGNDVDGQAMDAPAVDASYDAAGGCAPCGAPSGQTLCISGRVARFEDDGPVAETAISHAVVKAYDPIAFATNPTTPPAAMAQIGPNGCFRLDSVPRFPSGLALWMVDDDGAADDYFGTARAEQPVPNANLDGQVAYLIPRSLLNQWQQQIGTGPAGCPNGLAGCGMWIGIYLDNGGAPVAGARPTRPGDDPPAYNVFCFRGDRAHLSNEHLTDATGACSISPDAIEGHSGVCVSAGCNSIWPSKVTGVPPGYAWVDIFRAQ